MATASESGTIERLSAQVATLQQDLEDKSTEIHHLLEEKTQLSTKVEQLTLEVANERAEKQRLHDQNAALAAEVSQLKLGAADTKEVVQWKAEKEELLARLQAFEAEASAAALARDEALNKASRLQREREASDVAKVAAQDQLRRLQLEVGITSGDGSSMDEVAVPQEPEQPKSHDALEFYDAIMSIRNFRDAYNGGKGWSLRHNPDFNVLQDISAVRVIPLGHFNSGKTWLLGRLCGSRLPSGTDVHTEGISIKAAAMSNFSILLLDTVGANSPIGSGVLKKDTPGPLGATDVGYILAELRMQEEFYRMLTFKVAQVIILVVGQMSHKDQTDLLSLARDIRKGKDRKDIIVVHNLREWSREQLLQKDADGRNYLERNLDIFGLEDVSMDEQLPGGDKRRVDRHKGLFADPTGGSAQPVQVTHYYLTDDQLPCSLNEFALQNMRSIMTNMAKKKISVGQELADAASAVQSCFVRFTGPEPVIKFDAEAEPKRLVAAPRLEEKSYGEALMKPRKLGTYFSNGLEEVVYNVTAAPCTFEAREDEDDEDEDDSPKGPVKREAYIVQIELPGLTADSLTSIKKSLAKRGLRQEAPEVGTPKVLLVDFEAQLVNVPQGFYDVALKTSRHHYAITDDPALHEAIEQGTRPAFPDGVRTLKVTVWTNIEDRDNKYKPFVTYLDGIFGITLVREEVQKR